MRLTNYPQGLDVSDNNGVFDWAAWNEHIDFAMCKATEGPIPDKGYEKGYHDVEFERNWAAMDVLGIYRFAYHYAHPNHDPAQQARYFTDRVFSAGFEAADNLVLDLEEFDSQAPIDVSFWAWVFCHEVDRHVKQLLVPFKECLVYTYPAFAETGGCAKLGNRPLWIANYDTPAPHVPRPWATWAFWQWNGSGLDRDVFNGSHKDLEKFCTR